MKKVVALFFICALVLFSCSSEEEAIPENVISPSAMVQLLADIQLAEATIQLNNLSLNDSTKKIAYGYYNYIFQQNKLKPEQFKESFNYYVSKPVVLGAIYDSVITELSKRQAEVFNK